MSTAAEVLAARADRDAARAVFESRLAQVRADIDARSVGGRIADRLAEEAREIVDDGLAVAGESKGILAGVGVMLAAWLLRNPILAWAAERFDQLDHDEEHCGD